MKAYPAYNDGNGNWIGKIPNHWKMVRLKFVSPRITEKVDNPGEFEFQLALENIESSTGKILGSSSFEGVGNAFQKGDVLLNKLRPYLRKAVIAPSNGVAVGELLVLRPEKNVDGRFLHYWVLENGFISTVDGSTYGAKMPRANWDFIGNLKLSFPPLPEQQAIAGFLDCKTAQIDALIEKKQRQIELLREMRDVMTQNAMRSSKSKSLKLGEVADWVKRPINRQDEKPYEPIGLYNTGRGIFHKPITKGMDLGDSDFFEIKEGDFVISGQFAWEGAVALAQQEEDGCIASHRYYSLRGKPDRSETAYLFSFFTTQLGDNLLNHHSRGAAGRNRPLNINTLLREKIPVPPLSMQKLITDLIEKEVVLKKNSSPYNKQKSQNQLEDVLKNIKKL